MLSVSLPMRPDISSTSPTVVAEREKRGFEMGVPFCVEMQCAGVWMQKGRERERERDEIFFLKECHPVWQECGKMIILMYCWWKSKPL